MTIKEAEWSTNQQSDAPRNMICIKFSSLKVKVNADMFQL